MAQTSISPLLKQLVPSGTLGYAKVQLPPPSKAQADDDKLVCTGWSSQSVETAADSLLKSATRLGEEMEKEARYWEQVLSIEEQKWPVCRMPKERHTIGVRFGFSEGTRVQIRRLRSHAKMLSIIASPLFHARGLAALRPDSKGVIILDQGLSKKPKSMRVRIDHAGVITSVSRTFTDMQSSLSEVSGIESLIRQARDSLFEEELFHELLREVRAELLVYGTSIEDHVIRIPLEAFGHRDRAILVDLVDKGANQGQTRITEITTQSFSDMTSASTSADSIALTLRILLTQAYHLRFRKRSEPPPPMSEEKRSPMVHSLLRPVISHLQHAEIMHALPRLLSQVVSALQSAGLAARFGRRSTAQSQHSDTHAILAKELLESLTQALHMEFSLETSPYASKEIFQIIVQATTRLSSPSYGTVFQVTPPSNLPVFSKVNGAFSKAPMQYTTLASLEKYLTYLVCCSISYFIATFEGPSSVTVTNGSGEGPQGWELEDNGTELRRVWAAEKKVRRLSVLWQEGKLLLICAENGKRARLLGAWDGLAQADGGPAAKSLHEAVKAAGELEIQREDLVLDGEA